MICLGRLWTFSSVANIKATFVLPTFATSHNAQCTAAIAKVRFWREAVSTPLQIVFGSIMPIHDKWQECRTFITKPPV